MSVPDLSAPSMESNLGVGSSVLGLYTLTRVFEPEDIKAGSPAVWEAESPTASFIAKTWTKSPGEDVAVRAIWNHEVRSLLKVGGLPQAGEYFARLEALAADDIGYCVVVDGGGRALLSSALSDRNTHSWLRNVGQPARARLWAGLRRLATGLQLLHDHGILHRALRPECVFTDITGECDFRLSGFEWSLRLSAAGLGQPISTPMLRLRAPELESDQPAYSIVSDWFDFGLIAAELILGLRPNGRGLEALDAVRRSLQVAKSVTAEERDLIYSLLTPNPDERRALCAQALARVELITRQLSLPEKSADRPLLVAVRLTAGTDLAQAIYILSGRRVGINDAKGQLEFIQQDLADFPEVTARSSPVQHYVLHGKQINYRVSRFELDGSPSWRAGFCVGLDRGGRDPGQRQGLSGREVRVASAKEVVAALKDPRSRSSSWDMVVPFETSRVSGPGYDAYEFLKFTNHIDALMAASRVWPIRIVERGESKSGSWIAIEAVIEPNRDAMSGALGIDAAAVQMIRAFIDQVGEVDIETTFHLTASPKLSRVERDSATWVIMDAKLTGAGHRYWFRQLSGHAEIPTGIGYLRPTDIVGSLELLKRRLRAIEGLREQESMLQALEDPGPVSRDTLEEFEEDKEVQKLDDTKRKALKEIWRSQPIYALQGPPGTGKTALVTAMIRRALEIDSSLQFVTTAQANDTVDDLGGKLAKKLSSSLEGQQPILVRLDDNKSRLSPAALARNFAEKLATSTLANSAPPHIARRISTLAGGAGREGRQEENDMERLIAEAANVVMATSTSRGLANLLNNGKRFDWSVVEEAGKIHGFDLAMPMQASHRMLMIGDHEQLPAFNEKVFLDLLEHPGKVREALRNGTDFVSGKLGFGVGPVESEEDMQAFGARCERWRRMVRIFGHLFEVSRPLSTGGLNIAERLTEQHRMHPDLCELVSACFYPDLTTAALARERLASPDPFEKVPGSWMPDQRIVFVDMPYVQANKDASGQDLDRDGDFSLSSKAEADAVAQILSQFKPNDECLLQVLTPYNDQVSVIRQTVKFAAASGRLPHLEEFTIAGDGEFCATVDGFQGGEADIIVVSLVRNNHASPRGGVGFLTERARLNVMLSRAARKLVLVGSWDFFIKRASAAALNDPTDRLHHLAKVFDELENARKRGVACLYRGACTWGAQ